MVLLLPLLLLPHATSNRLANTSTAAARQPCKCALNLGDIAYRMPRPFLQIEEVVGSTTLTAAGVHAGRVRKTVAAVEIQSGGGIMNGSRTRRPSPLRRAFFAVVQAAGHPFIAVPAQGRRVDRTECRIAISEPAPSPTRLSALLYAPTRTRAVRHDLPPAPAPAPHSNESVTCGRVPVTSPTKIFRAESDRTCRAATLARPSVPPSSPPVRAVPGRHCSRRAGRGCRQPSAFPAAMRRLRQPPVRWPRPTQ